MLTRPGHVDETARVGAEAGGGERRQCVHVAVRSRYHVEAGVSGGARRRTAHRQDRKLPPSPVGVRRRERPRAVRAGEQDRLRA